MIRYTRFFAIIFTVFIAGQAFAKGAVAPKAVPTEAPAPAKVSVAAPQITVKLPTKTELDEVLRSVQTQFDQVETFIAEGKLGDARNLGNSITATIRRISGIETHTPKTFVVQNLAKSWPLEKSFEQLPIYFQTQLVNQVRNDLNGYYVDLLNIAKRATALYMKAHYLQLKGLNKLTQEDIDFSVDELVKVYAIPIYFIDANAAETQRVAFDRTVIERHLQQEFNRELLSVVLDLTVISEDSFKKKVTEAQTQVLQAGSKNSPEKAKSYVKLADLTDRDLYWEASKGGLGRCSAQIYDESDSDKPQLGTQYECGGVVLLDGQRVDSFSVVGSRYYYHCKNKTEEESPFVQVRSTLMEKLRYFLRKGRCD